jgi:methylmalonyl-CoA/ethylmalonyl-CoA epimerase
MDLFSRIDHVSLAVREFSKAKAFFENVFQVVPGAEGNGPPWDFHWCVFSLGDLTRLEIISPNGGGKFLENFLSEREGGVHHITLETPDIRKAKEHLERKSIPFFGYSEVNEEWKELFIHPKDAYGVLIQVAEFKPEDWLSNSVNFPKEGPRWSVQKDSDGVDLSIAHPGGGKAAIRLSKEEVKDLISDLEKML